MTAIPALPHGCNSWIVTRRDTGAVVGEFYDARIVARFNPERVIIETAADYLVRLNATLAAARGVA